MAGNAVILKPAPQAPKSAETIRDAFSAAGLPKGVIQVVHAEHTVTLALASDSRVGYVVFTGGVEGGQAIARATASGDSFASVGLELGGKDPAYVREDADVKVAAAALVDGEPTREGCQLTWQLACSIQDSLVNLSSLRSRA